MSTMGNTLSGAFRLVLLSSLFFPVSAFVALRHDLEGAVAKRTTPAPAPPPAPTTTTVSHAENERIWLVVGDGDLSYSATLAPTLDNARLLASVLEDQSTHAQVYRNSRQNTDAITSSTNVAGQGHIVHFGVDGTRLEDYFEANSLDRIIFNFPHWRGKSNHRYNRLLLKDFLSSSAKVLKREGEVHVALLNGQGGWEESSLEDWKRTWTAPLYANEAGLLLDRVEKFNVNYNLSSYRGSDKPFPKSNVPRQYVFRPPRKKDLENEVYGAKDIPIGESYQMSIRHELRLELDNDILQEKGYSLEDLTEGDLVLELLRKGLPTGIRAEMPLREVIQLKDSAPRTAAGKEGGAQRTAQLLVCLMVYSGESQPLTRELGNDIRARLEDLADEHLGLTIHKRGYCVSRIFPHKFLKGLVQGYTSS